MLEFVPPRLVRVELPGEPSHGELLDALLRETSDAHVVLVGRPVVYRSASAGTSRIVSFYDNKGK